MESSSCFMCGQNSEYFHFTSDTQSEQELSIGYILCQHFWFQEDVLQTAIICEPCWQTVDQFHRYYENVKQYHEQLWEPNSISIKQEQLESIIEVEQSKIETEVSYDEESELELVEECNQLSIEADQAVEILARNKLPLDPEAEQDDSFIQQHLAYNCDECSVKFESFLSMRRHMIDVHGQAYIMCCGAQYTSRVLLFQHVRTVCKPEAFVCELCARSYKSHVGYTRHKQLCQSTLFPCDQCSKQFPSQFQLNSHTEHHTKFMNRKYKCETCGKRYETRSTLKRHMVAVHEKNAVYVCDICPKSFIRKQMLKEHRLTHDYIKEQLRKQCPICKRWQRNARLWKRHMDRHNGEGEHKCDQCDHISASLEGLKRHIDRMHQKIRKCACDVCGKVYSNPFTLREHVANVHTKEPLYRCRFCEEEFFSSSRMYTHRKTAHPKEWQEYFKAKFGIDEADEENSI